MLVKYLAHTRTHTESYLDDVFRANVRELLIKAMESGGMIPDPERNQVLKDLDNLITETSPADLLSEISWAWQTESHKLAGGASGVCTIYIRGEIDKALSISSCEINQDGLHLSVIAEIS